MQQRCWIIVILAGLSFLLLLLTWRWAAKGKSKCFPASYLAWCFAILAAGYSGQLGIVDELTFEPIHLELSLNAIGFLFVYIKEWFLVLFGWFFVLLFAMATLSCEPHERFNSCGEVLLGGGAVILFFCGLLLTATAAGSGLKYAVPCLIDNSRLNIERSSLIRRESKPFLPYAIPKTVGIHLRKYIYMGEDDKAVVSAQLGRYALTYIRSTEAESLVRSALNTTTPLGDVIEQRVPSIVSQCRNPAYISENIVRNTLLGALSGTEESPFIGGVQDVLLDSLREVPQDQPIYAVSTNKLASFPELLTHGHFEEEQAETLLDVWWESDACRLQMRQLLSEELAAQLQELATDPTRSLSDIEKTAIMRWQYMPITETGHSLEETVHEILMTHLTENHNVK